MLMIIQNNKKRIGKKWIGPFLIVLFLLSGSDFVRSDPVEGKNIRTVRSEEGKVEVDAKIMPDRPHLSENLLLSIIGKHSSDYSLEKTTLPEIYGNFDVIESEYLPESIKDDVRTSSCRFLLRPQKSGDLDLPPIPIKIKKSGSDQSRTLLIPPGKIHIYSDYEKTEASLDKIKDPLGPLKNRSLLYVSIALAFVLGSGVLFFLWNRRSTRKTVSGIRILTPSERALDELETLMKSKIYERDVRSFYLKITGIVRWFIEETIGIRAPEQTTEEFLRELSAQRDENHLFDDSMRLHLKDFLEFSDLVKFAKFQPTMDDIFRGYKSARTVVEQSRSLASEEQEKKGDLP